MPDAIDPRDGRSLFGLNPQGYDAVRPDYPDWVYSQMARYGAFPGRCAAAEVGPGSGKASRRLVACGADPLILVEPDSRFVPLLRALTQSVGIDCRLLRSSFEDAPLESAQLDLIAAASSFHWVDQRIGLNKAYAILKPGGCIALWWNVFGDHQRRDPFHEATQSLLASLARSPSAGSGDTPFALDRAAREEALKRAGFEDIRYFASSWTLRLNAPQIARLYESFAAIQRLPEIERRALLESLERVAREEFGDNVQRNMSTCLYLARKAAPAEHNPASPHDGILG